jgi:hypothetical protein
VTVGTAVTILKTEGVLVALPVILDTTQVYAPALDAVTELSVSTEELAPKIFTPLNCH